MGCNSIERQLSFCAWQDHVESPDTIACDEEQRTPRSKISRTLPLRTFLIRGSSIEDSVATCMSKCSMVNAQHSSFNSTCRLLCRAKSRHLCSNLERFLDSARNARIIERWRLNSFMTGIVVKPLARIFHGRDWVFSSEVVKVFGKPTAM